MTAVEWFYQRILAKDIKEVFEQAKEMEKQQLEKAFVDGAFLFRGDDEDNRFNEWFEQFKNK
jgi:hypothetical protein